MRRNTKAFMVFSILGLPVLVFLFLKGCGTNEFKLPVYFPYDSVLVDGKYEITDAHTIPEFSFVSHTGDSISLSDIKGKITVADFFFTRCSGICPEMTSELTRVQENFIDNEDIKIVSFTVDPENDDVEVLANYAAEYKADSRKWSFVTGEKEELYSLARKGFFVTAMEEVDIEDDFIHSEKLILIDKEGRIRGYYTGTDREDVDRLITEINLLLHEYNKK
ncbi:SCO family protein [Cytophagaceae bacterium ABcell3]|nr:SCO family protein [Cytophagaceae bacterium ABcell3]